MAVQRFVAVVAVALAASTAATSLAAADTDNDPTTTTDVATDSFVRTPDVWFVVLDGLAGTNVLADVGVDDTRFLERLRELGFTVQSDATSNYPLTNLSLSSTLSMNYTFTGRDEPTTGDFFLHMSGGNATVEMFRANGYGYAHAFPGFYIGSRCVGFEDVCVGDDGFVTETEVALATRTPLRRFVLAESEVEEIARANDPDRMVQRLLAAQLPGPTFHFVHSLSPHPPHLRDARCRVRQVPLELAAWGDGREYAEAVRCLHDQLADAAARILTNDPGAVVVIQGDHGPRLGTDPSSVAGSLLDDDMHFDILSAVHLPVDCDHLEVPDDLTPVNTFRVVRACLEDAAPDLVANRRFPVRRRP